ncbi:MFS family permease [Rhodopseudomonas rhenobacensis]|uniref:MFS family permease n=1 Tax=Rhodopseudomonas rhenobacensis TaxID=87461 RepID=A0A7W8DZF4_9BRAD|nr:MDR family MFS transporter [Rhodopseudomonas rhenobacensis]MBB5047810.1 MFS family permease [Rhodopseudomonas rhenobacensis]
MTEFESQRREAAEDVPSPVASAASPTGEVIELDDAPPLTPAAPLTPAEVRAILLSLLLAMFLAALDQTIVATALPTIGRQFHDVGNLSWVITAYLLASTAVAPVFGTLSDIFGRRATIITAMGLFIAGSVLCALAPNISVLIVARGLQGLGGGGILPIVQTVISDVVSPRERGQYQAYFSGVWVAASIGGPVIGGVFAEHLHWSLIFWINLPLGVGALALLLPKMGKIPVFHRRRKVDWLGGLLLMAAAVAMMLVLTWGGTRFAWSSPTILSMLGAAALLALSFVWHALRNPEPFLPLPLMGGTVVPYAMAAGGCAIGVLIGLTVSMPLYYEVVYGLSASASGLALIPIVGVSVLGAAFAGRATTRWTHYKRVAVVGNSFAAMMCLGLAVATPLPLPLLLAVLALLSVGIGTVFPISLVSIQNAVPRSQVGTATGAMNFFRQLMASFAVAAFTAILLATLGGGVPIGREHGDAIAAIPPDAMIAAFRHVFVASAALMSVSALCMVLMEERPLAGPDVAADLAE